MTQDTTTLAPQLRIAGEGEVIIARRGNLSLPSPTPPAEPPIESILAPVGRGAWQAQRVRTGGVDCILRVTDGTEEHTVEYRSGPDHRAVVLRDRKRIYHGPYQGNGKITDCRATVTLSGILWMSSRV